MSNDPFKASIQCLVIIALVISGIVYLTGWGIGNEHGPAAVMAAIYAGVVITGHLAVLAVAMWVLSSFFK